MEFIDAGEVLDRDILDGFADLMERRPHRVEEAAMGVVVGNLGFAPHPCRLSGVRRLYLKRRALIGPRSGGFKGGGRLQNP